MERRTGHLHGRGGGRNLAVFPAVCQPRGAGDCVSAGRPGRRPASGQPGPPRAFLEDGAPFPYLMDFARVLWLESVPDRRVPVSGAALPAGIVLGERLID